MHLLLFLEPGFVMDTPESINEVVCAELPDISWDPIGKFTDIVTSILCHGPCGDDNPKAPCMCYKVPGAPFKCSKSFPKPFCLDMVVHEDSYPEYRRRDNGRTFTVPKPGFPNQVIVRDNRWVVPYNPYLLQKFESHINVEVCAIVQAVKYMHKYIYKGSDYITLMVTNPEDKIT